MLKLDNVQKTYVSDGESVRALDGASLELAAGEVLAVRGASGCGKTTLPLAAGGLLHPDAGRVEIDGRDPYELSGAERAKLRAKTVGFVFQQYHLIPYLTVLDNVLAPTLAIADATADARAAELLERLRISDRADHLPAELSTGERQRTALARAMLNKPTVILADEPTGNLDDDNARIVLECLAEHARADGAVLLVTHDARTAEFATRNETMRDGRIETG